MRQFCVTVSMGKRLIGKAMAAHLAIMGFETVLFNRSPDRVAVIRKRGGIDLESYEGAPRGFGRLKGITSDYAEGLAGADVVMVVTPSSAHREIAANCAWYRPFSDRLRRVLRESAFSNCSTASTGRPCSSSQRRSRGRLSANCGRAQYSLSSSRTKR